MSHKEFINTEEYTRRIIWLTNTFSNYRLKFPILYWSTHFDERNIFNGLLNSLITFELYKGSNYDSYAENDYDYCIITNINQSESTELTLAPHIYSIKCVDTIFTNIENIKISYPFLWNQNFENILGISYFSHHFTNVLDNIYTNENKCREKVKIIGTVYVSTKDEKRDKEAILAQL